MRAKESMFKAGCCVEEITGTFSPMISNDTIYLSLSFHSPLHYPFLHKKVFILRVSVITPIPVTQIFICSPESLKGAIPYVHLLDISPHSHISKIIPHIRNQCHHPALNIDVIFHSPISFFAYDCFFLIFRSQNLEAIDGLYTLFLTSNLPAPHCK